MKRGNAVFHKKREKRKSTWDLKKKKELNEEILKEIGEKLAEA